MFHLIHLAMDRLPLLSDAGQLGLQLLLGPIRVAQLIDIPILLFVQFLETRRKSFPNPPLRVLLILDCFIDSSCDLFAHLVIQSNPPVALYQEALQYFSQYERLTTLPLLPSIAGKVVVNPTFALGPLKDHPAATPATPEQAKADCQSGASFPPYTGAVDVHYNPPYKWYPDIDVCTAKAT